MTAVSRRRAKPRPRCGTASQRFKHQNVHDQGHEKQPERGSDDATQNEKPSARFVGLASKPRPQETVDACEFEFIVKGE